MFFLVQGQDDFIAANVEKKQKMILTNKWRDERKCIYFNPHILSSLHKKSQEQNFSLLIRNQGND